MEKRNKNYKNVFWGSQKNIFVILFRFSVHFENGPIYYTEWPPTDMAQKTLQLKNTFHRSHVSAMYASVEQISLFATFSQKR